MLSLMAICWCFNDRCWGEATGWDAPILSPPTTHLNEKKKRLKITIINSNTGQKKKTQPKTLSNIMEMLFVFFSFAVAFREYILRTKSSISAVTKWIFLGIAPVEVIISWLVVEIPEQTKMKSIFSHASGVIKVPYQGIVF